MRNAMDVTMLRTGDRIRTVDGSTAEVLAPSEDGAWIRVRYLEVPRNPEIVNTEDLCSGEEIAEQLQAH
jgi:hypothetical protein